MERTTDTSEKSIILGNIRLHSRIAYSTNKESQYIVKTDINFPVEISIPRFNDSKTMF